MTGLILQVLWLLSTWLMYPNYQQPISAITAHQEIQALYQQQYEDEIERNYLAEQKEIIINDYFLFATKIWKINYARWCAGWYERATRSEEKQEYISCWKKSFDCGWAMKAYLKAKGIFDDIGWLNSQKLYELGTPKDPRMAERWDFMYRRWFGDVASGNMSTHFAMVAEDYSGWNEMWIYDNVVPGWVDRYNKRLIRVSCNSKYCSYMGKYRLYIATNGAREVASKAGIEVLPWIDTTPVDTWSLMSVSPITNPANPLGFHITIDWYAYDSEANRIANRWYVRNHSEDMIGTYLCENWGFNPKSVSHTNDYWLCQLSYRYNKELIDNPLWETLPFQKQACLDKWNNVADKDLRVCYDKRKSYMEKIIPMTWGFRTVDSL